MSRTVVALYDDFATANAAVRELVDNGITRDDISLLASDESGEYGRYVKTDATTDTSATAQGAGVGAGIGAVIGGLGGLLLGLGALTIPGIGPVLAAGPLAAALTGLAGAGAGAVAGGLTGGLIGALVDMGVPEDTAQYYAEGIRRGGTLVSVRTDDTMTDRAVDILNRHDPIDINERVSQWRESGWAGFDANAQPYRADEMSADVVSGRNFSDFTTYDAAFRNHFASSLYGGGYTYEQYQPAYRYGYDLATDTRYRERDWVDVELEAQRYWEERNPGTWDRIKNAVRHAWEEVKETVD
jgi:hypothetical protein